MVHVCEVEPIETVIVTVPIAAAAFRGAKFTRNAFRGGTQHDGR